MGKVWTSSERCQTDFDDIRLHLHAVCCEHSVKFEASEVPTPQPRHAIVDIGRSAGKEVQCDDVLDVSVVNAFAFSQCRTRRVKPLSNECAKLGRRALYFASVLVER